MNKATAYKALSKELDEWSRKEAKELKALAGSPAQGRAIDLDGENVVIEVWVSWFDSTQQNLVLEAVANGSSHWNTVNIPAYDIARPGR